jgi:formylglycine-generating enzyme
MKVNLKIAGILMFVVLGLSSCKFFKSSDVSQTTGWAYNDPENGGYDVAMAVEQKTGPGLVLIEGGTFTMGRVEQDVMFDWNNIPRRVTLPSFYMDQTEVRNVDYREYLYWINRVFVDYPEVYKNALPDTLVWRRRLAYNEPYVDYYFRHPAYNEYPVVGVNWLQAEAYCAWRTDRVNEQILVEQGIFEHKTDQKGQDNFNTDAYLAGQYKLQVKENLEDKRNPDNKDGRPVRVEDGIFLPKYRLPTEAEWEYAALALMGNSVDERIYNRKLFPWNGHFVRNDEKNERGWMRANFQRGRGDMMGVAGYLNDAAAVPNRVDAYWPNDFGLYNMAGNVNEWVLDVYRTLSNVDVAEFRPFRGNIFTTVSRDTASGAALPKDKYGRIITRRMTYAESMNRTNYQKADNINYLDGDPKSLIRGSGGGDWDWTDPDTVSDISTKRMYFQGKGDKKEGITSLVNDHTRVYKGGSWRDRVYWMVPGTRRFLDEKMSSDDLGFRCAMIRVGENTEKK